MQDTKNTVRGFQRGDRPTTKKKSDWHHIYSRSPSYSATLSATSCHSVQHKWGCEQSLPRVRTGVRHLQPVKRGRSDRVSSKAKSKVVSQLLFWACSHHPSLKPVPKQKLHQESQVSRPFQSSSRGTKLTRGEGILQVEPLASDLLALSCWGHSQLGPLAAWDGRESSFLDSAVIPDLQNLRA